MFYSADQYIYEWVCSSVKEELKSRSDLTWTMNQQIAFFMSMFGLKPVGVNRHFMMLCLHHKFSVSIDAEVPTKVLWDELDTLYDMAALHESEIIPFPNDEVDFELPKDCHDLYKSKYGMPPKTTDSAVKSRLRNTDSYKLLRKLKASRMKQFIPVAVTNKSRSPIVLKNEAMPKAKQDPASSAKPTKDKRSSSPFSGIKQEGSEVLGKKMKPERSISPSPQRKTMKNDTSNPPGSSRKQTKEATPVSSRSAKEQTPDSLKKTKTDKESSLKKSKTVQSSDTPMSRKSTKPEIDLKTRGDYASSIRKKSESSSIKLSRTESKNQESDASSLSGSRKSSSSAKGKNVDSHKKMKTSRPEEPSKKVTPGPKRRRIT